MFRKTNNIFFFHNATVERVYLNDNCVCDTNESYAIEGRKAKEIRDKTSNLHATQNCARDSAVAA